MQERTAVYGSTRGDSIPEYRNKYDLLHFQHFLDSFNFFSSPLSLLFLENVEISIRCQVWAKNANDTVEFKLIYVD